MQSDQQIIILLTTSISIHRLNGRETSTDD